MPRQNRRRTDDAESRRPGATLSERREQWRGDEYVVRALAGSAAAKASRCPGCDQQIAAGAPHVVAWPLDDADAGHRRHWHTPCWVHRERRAPGIQRSRSAPHY